MHSQQGGIGKLRGPPLSGHPVLFPRAMILPSSTPTQSRLQSSTHHTWLRPLTSLLVISRAAVVAYMPLLRRSLPFPKGPCFPHIPRNTRLTRFMFSLTAGVTRDLKLGGREWRSGRAPFWGLHTYPCPSHYACAWTPTKLRLRPRSLRSSGPSSSCRPFALKD